MNKQITIVLNDTDVIVNVTYNIIAPELEHYEGTGIYGGVEVLNVKYNETDITQLLQKIGEIETLEEILND